MITNVSHNAVICIRSSTAKHFWVRSGTERTFQENEFELIPTIKMETRHPGDIYFGREFAAICYHCGVIWRPEVVRNWKFSEICAFFWKTPPYDKIFPNSVLKVYIATPIDVVVCKIREKYPTGNRWNRALFTWQKAKFRLPLKLSLQCGSRPKSVMASPQHLARITHNVSNFIQIGSLSAELSYSGIAGRVKAVLWAIWVNPILAQSLGE